MILPILLGFGSGLSLIMAIGAQNAFVLRQGIRREHVLPVVLICGFTDALLEFLGVAGIGYVIEQAPLVVEFVRWGGVAFLLWYAWTAIRRARKPQALDPSTAPRDAGFGSDTAAVSTEHAAAMASASRKKVVLACLAITYLNPHVYLDTTVLMGSIGNAQGDPERWWFLLGGAVSSIAWFFVLGYGSRSLTRFFTTPRSWRILDGIVAAIMFVIAARLAFGGIGV